MGTLEMPAQILEPHGRKVASSADMILVSQLDMNLQAAELLCNVWTMGTLDASGKFCMWVIAQQMVDFSDMDAQLLCALSHEVAGGTDAMVGIFPQSFKASSRV